MASSCNNPAAGFVGVIPALSIMTPAQNPPDGPLRLSWGQLILWALALAFLGVFMAVPLRVQTILKEKLRCAPALNGLQSWIDSFLDTERHAPLPAVCTALQQAAWAFEGQV